MHDCRSAGVTYGQPRPLCCTVTIHGQQLHWSAQCSTRVIGRDVHFPRWFYTTWYEIPMKWKLEGDCVSWCDVSPSEQGTLTVKGVPCAPHYAICDMWHRWPDHGSPNCTLVLQSTLPSLVRRAFMLCSSLTDCLLNFQAIVQGCGFKSYPWAWWWMPLWVRIQDLGVLGELPLHKAKLWYQRGFSKGGHRRAPM